MQRRSIVLVALALLACPSCRKDAVCALRDDAHAIASLARAGRYDEALSGIAAISPRLPDVERKPGAETLDGERREARALHEALDYLAEAIDALSDASGELEGGAKYVVDRAIISVDQSVTALDRECD
jgi:hypothetical protein